MRNDRKTTRPGFTLVEILAVVIIIGIAGAIIVPQIGSRDDLKAAAAARVIMADLIYAQNMAITQQSNYYVQFSTSAKNYSVVNSALAAVTHPVNKTTYTTTFGASGTTGMKECTLVSVTFVGQAASPTYATIGFDELGTPLIHTGAASQTMTSGSLVIQVGVHKLRIDVEAYTGQITVTSI